MTGANKCGMLLKPVSSTILGSTIRNFSSSGGWSHSMPVMIELMHTLLPDPVAPAMSRCGMAPRSTVTAPPDTSRPRGMRRKPFSFRYASDSNTPRSETIDTLLLGTSMPTMGRPGTGASMRMGAAARARARSLTSELILLTRTRWRRVVPSGPGRSM